MLEGYFPVDWEKFHFLRPDFLWLFVPLLAWFAISLLSIRQDLAWKQMISPHLRPYVIRKGSEKLKFWMQGLLLLSMSLGICALSGPTWKQVEVPGKELETPLVVLLELSSSMLEDDLQPTRLERAKFKISDFLDKDPRARAALIGFAGTAHTIMPLTRDYNLILSHIDGLSPDVMPLTGSDLAAGLALADSLTAITDAPGTILILSDEVSDETFSLIQDYVIQSKNQVEFLPMFAVGAEVQEQMNLLGRLQALDKVNVNRLTLDNSDVEAIAKRISGNLIFTEQDGFKEDEWQDMGMILVIPMAVLLLFWFRRGWVLYSVLILTFTSCGKVETFEDLWYSKDYQGQRLMDNQDYDGAAGRFEDPMRRGVAYYKAGAYTDAIQAFRQDSSAQGAYNLGLAYAQTGDFLSAEMAFAKAIELDPNLDQAKTIQNQLAELIPGTEELSPEQAAEADQGGNQGGNMENKDMEDLGGGGQEATEEQMNDGRKEEEVATDTRTAKELDEVPEELQISTEDQGGKVLMRKVDDDPALFLKKKFEYQVKQGQVKPRKDEN
ncbi:VWA domain-containing protein [Algoriphagus namhaensis]